MLNNSISSNKSDLKEAMLDKQSKIERMSDKKCNLCCLKIKL